MSDEPKVLPIPYLTPLLKARLERHKAKLPPFLPMYDRVFVYPIEDADQPDTTAGGIVIAQQTKNRLGAQRGILVAAGLKAFEYLHSYGAKLGDYVITMRLSPWSRFYLDREGRPHSVLILYASDITANEDLVTRYNEGELFMEMTPDGRARLSARDEGPRVLLDPPETDDGV